MTVNLMPMGRGTPRPYTAQAATRLPSTSLRTGRRDLTGVLPFDAAQGRASLAPQNDSIRRTPQIMFDKVVELDCNCKKKRPVWASSQS